MKPNRIWPILMALGSLAIMWGGGDADVPFPDSSPEQRSAVSVVAPSNCAHLVLTASENPENKRIVGVATDTQSAGIEGEQ
ncbi:hypothetical protein BANT918_01359 [Brevibacterium antiquum CNRZ 918]|uniref:Uncharacterized protein n=1 Tax=Brevibacterium antiquum CNRZ 918 TaxID=1255637 RepID=A0A2H1J2Q7_9MICO|nr:hypothetical protein BANT918_01359 [Brevibacterium antiquum CNRZ 918]